MFDQSVKISRTAWGFLFLLLVMSYATINPFATFCAILFLPISVKLLYRRNEPPVLFLAVFLQWLQVSIKIFYADIFYLDFPTGFEYPDHVQQAYYSSLVGLLFLSLGIFVVVRKTPVCDLHKLRDIARNYSVRKITIIYVLAIFLTPVLLKFGSMAGGIQQFIIKIVDLKWSLLFIFYLIVFLKQESKRVFYIIVAFEVILSFTGYFSSFKDYFLALGLGFLMLHQHLRFRQVFIMIIGSIILLNLFIVWTYIKPQYRKYLTHGQMSQRVDVGSSEALSKVAELASKMDTASYRQGTVMLLERISYIDYYSAAITYVPASLPYERGKLWFAAMTNIFMPRILFPNKPVLDDSKRLNKYTGLNLAGADKGTSVSLGYMAETYVDFGPWLMFIPIFLFGLLIGFMFNYIVRSILWGYAFLMPLFFSLNVFEVSLDKLAGGILSFFIVMWILNKWRVPELLDRFLIKRNAR